jgi:hypothetical protein
VSSRWSYGPEGLRERPAKRWSEAELLPSWRELQPLLIRSAGVVGIVALIMAVVSSDALRFASEEPVKGGSVLPPAPATAPTPVASVAAPAADPGSPPAVVVGPNVADLLASEEEREATPIAAPAETPSAVATAPAETPSAVATAPAETPSAVATAPQQAPEVPIPDQPVTSDLRSGAAPDPAASAQPPLTTASVPPPTPAAKAIPAEGPASGGEAGPGIAKASDTEVAAASAAIRARLGGTAPDVASIDPAATELPLATLDAAPSLIEAVESARRPPSRAWQDGASTCPRDWVAPGGTDTAGDATRDCAPTEELIASVASAESALEALAAEHAETLAALLPRVPLPRPDVVPDIKRTPVRTANRNSSWPAGPPPNCTAGQRAKWRFTDRKAGTKEWYCR